MRPFVKDCTFDVYTSPSIFLLSVFFAKITGQSNSRAETQAMQYLTQQTQRCVVKSKSVQPGHIEINAEVRLREENTDFVNTLCGIEGVNSAVLVSYNGDYMG